MHSLDEKVNFCELAIRYLTGIASEAECQLLRERLEEPENDALFEDLRLGWEKSPKALENACDVDDVFRRVAQAVSSETEDALATVQSSPIGIRRWFIGPVLAAAASIAIAAFSSIPWFKPHSPGTVKTQPIAWVQQTCGVSERMQVALEDGTKIILNSGSTLSHPKAFGPRSRVVRLTGEAFFDVTHDGSRPFIVETPTLRIKVLGTQFNVQAFADGSESKVSLVKGKVEVSELTPSVSGQADAPKPVHLTPGQEYELAPETRKADVKSVSAQAATGWMQDRFFWDLEPAASAMHQLERRYGILVEFTDQKLGRLRLNGRFEQKSLEEIFETLRITEVFDYKIVRENNGKIARVILSPGDMSAPTAPTSPTSPSSERHE